MSHTIYRGLPRAARMFRESDGDPRKYDALTAAYLVDGTFILEYHLGGDKTNTLCTLTFPADQYRLQLT